MPHFSAAVSNCRMAIRKEFRSSLVSTGIGTRAVAIEPPLKCKSGHGVVDIHIGHTQFFAGNDFGMRMTAFRAGSLGVRRKVEAAPPADRQMNAQNATRR